MHRRRACRLATRELINPLQHRYRRPASRCNGNPGALDFAAKVQYLG